MLQNVQEKKLKIKPILRFVSEKGNNMSAQKVSDTTLIDFH